MLHNSEDYPNLIFSLVTGAVGSIIAAALIFVFWKTISILLVGTREYQTRKIRTYFEADRQGRLIFKIMHVDAVIHIGLISIITFLTLLVFLAVAGDKVQIDRTSFSSIYIISELKNHLYDNQFHVVPALIEALFLLPSMFGLTSRIDMTSFASNPLRYIEHRQRLYRVREEDVADILSFYRKEEE